MLEMPNTWIEWAAAAIAFWIFGPIVLMAIFFVGATILAAIAEVGEWITGFVRRRRKGSYDQKEGA